jgi:hypothetical protein
VRRQWQAGQVNDICTAALVVERPLTRRRGRLR